MNLDLEVELPLPTRALALLVQPLKTAAALPRSARDSHTVPIESQAWRVHTEALTRCIVELRVTADLPDRSFDGLRESINTILAKRAQAAGALLSLEPFEPYDSTHADELLGILDQLPETVATAVESGSPVAAGMLRMLEKASSWWSARESLCPPGESMRVAFDLPRDPIDGLGGFRPELVIQHYAHRAVPLLRRLVPHLISLGGPHVTDLLAGISIVGRVLRSQDPVHAYVTVDTFTRRYLAADAAVAAQVREYLLASEPALQRTEHSIYRAIEVAEASADDSETRAHAVADAYKRAVEGPFRRFAWALHCLRDGSWSEPPTLGPLRERLIAGGDTLARLTEIVVLPALRNSETHESLVWDGFAEQFITEDGAIPYDVVLNALVVCRSFAQGAHAGLAAVRGLNSSRTSVNLPSVDEEGRMPTADRVRAFFGTNRLMLVEARLNTPHAHFRVQRLGMPDINPCFQALLLARRLLPQTESFAVSSMDCAVPLLAVDADALDAAMPAWEYAVSHLDQMPLATFLPANYAARQRMESPAIAARAVAWIAVDDAVGVIDGSAPSWNSETRRLLGIRLQVVAIAIEHTRRIVPIGTARLDSVYDSVLQLRNWIVTADPASAWSADEQPALQRLRSQWNTWGPVVRMPSILELPAPHEVTEAQPQLRAVEPSEYLSF